MTNRNDTPLIVLSLPWPPSVNSIWRAYKGRNIKTERYRIWQRAAMNEAAAQKQKPIPGPVDVEIQLGRPDKRRRDLDNYSKAVLDLVCHASLIDDDSCLQRLTIGWCDKTAPKTATVLVWPAEAA